MPRSVPLVAWILAFYSLGKLAGQPDTPPWYQMRIPHIGMMSGDTLDITQGDVLLALALMLLLVDLVHAYQARDRSLPKHVWSFLVFVGSLVLFITIPGFGHAGFLIYILIVLCDLTAGLLIMVAGRREAMWRAPEEGE